MDSEQQDRVVDALDATIKVCDALEDMRRLVSEGTLPWQTLKTAYEAAKEIRTLLLASLKSE